MDKLDYCFHSHTKRCGHAYGEDEEYVKSAIKGGFTKMGFSDHVMLPNFVQKGMRGDYSLVPGYVTSVRALEKKYAKDITIRLGFECEWYWKQYENYYKNLLSSRTVDYLILGQHNIALNGTGVFYGDIADSNKALNMYGNDLIDGMESGLFLYVCHPDLFMIWYEEWNDKAIAMSKRIIAKAKELQMPLEVNMGPSRWRNNGEENGELRVPYPNPEFWKLASEAGVDVVIGVDAHSPSDYLDSDFAWVLSFIKRHNLHLLTGEEVLAKIDKKR
jgi:histidinol-phosphatase (PHP family)